MLQHAVGASCSQLRSSCVQYIRGMFDVVQQTDAWAGLDDALKREVTELTHGKSAAATRQGPGDLSSSVVQGAPVRGWLRSEFLEGCLKKSSVTTAHVVEA